MRPSPMPDLLALALLAALTAACGGIASRGMPPLPEAARTCQSGGLGPGDVVEVRVYEEDGLTGLYRLGTDGTFSFPLVGAVQAGGLSPTALGDALTARLKDGYLRDPQVSVFVKESNSKKFFVLGEVARPGTFTYDEQMTIVQAVTLAGGLKTLAAANRLRLTRTVGGAEQQYEVPFEDISSGRAPNVPLQPCDIVFVPESWL